MSLQFVNNFRGIAILMVMLAHALTVVPWDQSAELEAMRLLVDNCTIVFVVIAGYLFYVSTANFSYLPYLKGKILSVLIPYVITSTPAAILYMTGIKKSHWWMDIPWLQSLSIPEQYGFLMLSGAHLGPLWFIPMIIILYFLSPVLVWLKDKPALIVAFLVSLAVAFYLGRPLFNNSPFMSLLYFLPAYLFGMILAKHARLYEALTPQGAILPLLVFIAEYILSLYMPISSSVDLLFKLALSLAIMTSCKAFANRKIAWLDLFARLSFYLFFIHGYFTALFRFCFRHTEPGYGWIFVTIAFFAVITLSLAIYVIAKPILGRRSKYVIGA